MINCNILIVSVDLSTTGLYHGATGTIVDIQFKEAVGDYPEDVFRLLPKSKSDGSMAKQAYHGRPLPVVEVQLDNPKIDPTIFPNRRVLITPQRLPICERGQVTINRYESMTDSHLCER